MDIWDLERILEMLRRAVESEFCGGYYEEDEISSSERGEIIKTDDTVSITFELREIPENFEIEAQPLKLQLRYIDRYGFDRRKYIRLPCSIDPDSLNFTVKNGIVDIKLKRIKDGI